MPGTSAPLALPSTSCAGTRTATLSCPAFGPGHIPGHGDRWQHRHEEVFQYPGSATLSTCRDDQDFFLLQGIFLFIILGVLIANFIIDIVYVMVDPRTRLSMQGAQA